MKKNVKYIIVDVESTGCDNLLDKIFDIAFLLSDGENIIGEYQSYVKVEEYLVDKAVREIGSIIKIEKKLILGARDSLVVFEEVIQFLKKIHNEYPGAVLVAHNVRFDYGMILSNLNNVDTKMRDIFRFMFENKKLDSILVCRKLYPGLPKYSLSSLIRTMKVEEGIELLEDREKNKHSALLDCKILFYLLKKIIKDFPFVNLTSIQ